MESITTECKNCGKIISDKYCEKCGQSAATGRINLHYIYHELQHSILHVDKGVFYTVRALITEPGIFLKGYLAGKRINHFKPFSFVILWAAVYAFVVHLLGIYPEANFFEYRNSDVQQINRIALEWLYSHYSLVICFALPIAALSTYLFFLKSKYNYMEHMVIGAYISGMQILISLILFPLHYTPLSVYVYYITMSIGYIYTIYALCQLFEGVSSTRVNIIKVISSLLFSFLLIFICVTIVMVLLISLTII